MSVAVEVVYNVHFKGVGGVRASTDDVETGSEGGGWFFNLGL